MLFEKKESEPLKKVQDRSVTGEFEIVIKELDETLKKDQNVKDECKTTIKKLRDSVPPTRPERLKK